MRWPTQHHAKLGLPCKGGAIKGLVVCNDWNLELLDLLNKLKDSQTYQMEVKEIIKMLTKISFLKTKKHS